MRTPLRATSVAVAVLMFGAVVAQAADSNKDARDACKTTAAQSYNDDKASCDTLPAQDLYETCLRHAYDRYVDQLVKCDNKYPKATKPGPDDSVGGANSNLLDGRHPKGSRTSGLRSGEQPGVFDNGSPSPSTESGARASHLFYGLNS